MATNLNSLSPSDKHAKGDLHAVTILTWIPWPNGAFPGPCRRTGSRTRCMSARGRSYGSGSCTGPPREAYNCCRPEHDTCTHRDQRTSSLCSDHSSLSRSHTLCWRREREEKETEGERSLAESTGELSSSAQMGLLDDLPVPANRPITIFMMKHEHTMNTPWTGFTQTHPFRLCTPVHGVSAVRVVCKEFRENYLVWEGTADGEGVPHSCPMGFSVQRNYFSQVMDQARQVEPVFVGMHFSDPFCRLECMERIRNIHLKQGWENQDKESLKCGRTSIIYIEARTSFCYYRYYINLRPVFILKYTCTFKNGKPRVFSALMCTTINVICIIYVKVDGVVKYARAFLGTVLQLSCIPNNL